MANPALEARLMAIGQRADPAELAAEMNRLAEGYNLLGYVFECWTNRPDCVDWRAYERLCDVIHRIESGEAVGLDEPWLSDPNGKGYELPELIAEVLIPGEPNGGLRG